jgi:hypothetical protein
VVHHLDEDPLVLVHAPRAPLMIQLPAEPPPVQDQAPNRIINRQQRDKTMEDRRLDPHGQLTVKMWGGIRRPLLQDLTVLTPRVCIFDQITTLD